jgi:hypothetical protein
MLCWAIAKLNAPFVSDEAERLIGQEKGGCAVLFSPFGFSPRREETLAVAEERSRAGMNTVIWAGWASWALADWSEL